MAFFRPVHSPQGSYAHNLQAVVSAIAGLIMRTHLQVGNRDLGAPELRANSRYNLDNAYITSNDSASSDVLDPDGAKYRAAYSEKYPNIWRHGDFILITPGAGYPSTATRTPPSIPAACASARPESIGRCSYPSIEDLQGIEPELPISQAERRAF